MLLALALVRELAYDSLIKVMENRRSPEKAIEDLYQGRYAKGISRHDLIGVREILLGSLRWYSKILWILQNTASRDLEQVPAPVRAALVAGTYQIFYMDRVQDRIAVNESVEYVRSRGLAHACSFVNGILRQIARRAEYFTKPDKVQAPVDYLALQFAHPRWIVERWLRRFKFERMELILAANNHPPPNTLRINSTRFRLEEASTLQQHLLKDERTHSDRRPLRSALRAHEDPRTSDGSLYAQGALTIQDEFRQLMAPVVQPQAGDLILQLGIEDPDVFGHLAEVIEALSPPGSASLLALDMQPERVERANQEVRRLGFHHAQAHTGSADGSFLEGPLWQGRARPGKIVIDAPSSGLGVLRRHPELKWQTAAPQVEQSVERQRVLLEQALRLIAPGGEITLMVRSFEDEETRYHLEWLQRVHGSRVEPISPVGRLPDYYKKYVTRENLLLAFAGNQDAMDGGGAFVFKVQTPVPT